ncbi:LCP family protein [Nocardioides acrostichi]|uniref:LCP family protein n=1 Tax=Nocardioides acrostichi TaxID=2784339 RepID=A0A930UUG3_9ACTN|nr:LCP family protein [Nocardioides acrostichi]MBF4160406.1 LCP family protein [Nocardioides acrostichi]
MADSSLRAGHRYTAIRVIVVTHLVLALVTATGVTLAYRHLNGNISGEDVSTMLSNRPEKKKVEGPKEPLNILVVGDDSRQCEGCDIDNQEGSQGSDVTLLIHVSADRQDAYGVSLPRDALVTRPDCKGSNGQTIPGGKLQMFNTAYAVGGVACTIQTVEQLTGVRIDHYVSVNFGSFVGMVDAVGGVQVCIPREVDDQAHGIHFDAGTQTLEGRQALNYVRERYVLSVNSDIGRMRRQQAFIASMIHKVFSAGTLTRPDRVYNFLSAATQSLTVDPQLDSISHLVDLARQFKSTNLADIDFVTVPFETYEPDPNRLIWSPKADKLWRRIKNDRPLTKKLQRQSINAADPVGSTSADASASPSENPSASESAGTKKAQNQERLRQKALEDGLCA